MPAAGEPAGRSPGRAAGGGGSPDGPTSTVRTFLAPGGLRLRADVLAGTGGPPVLLIHGGGQTRGVWDETAGALAAHGWPAVALDLRGHGESDWSPDGEYTLDAYASDVRAVAAALGSPPVLVGASLGGLIALLAIGEPPGVAVAGLVLVDVAHRFEVRGAQRILDVMAGDGGGVDGAAAGGRHLPRRPGAAGQDGLRGTLCARDQHRRPRRDPRVVSGVRRLMDPETAAERRAQLATHALTAPTLLVRGGVSDLVTHEIAEEFTRLCPVARVTEVRGAGHMVVSDRNGDVTEAVARFLRSLPGAMPRLGA
jgi:pimeloyl-ACP methyl ester carboxylesterase